MVTSLELAARGGRLAPAGRASGGRGPELEGLSAALANALEGAERVTLLMRDLRAFSREEREQREAVDVEHALDAATKLATNEIQHRARLVKEYGGVPAILASEPRLTQLFLNLLVDAAQAIPEGHAQEHEIRLATRSADGRVIVEVRDTGAGIAPARLARIFEPFVTDKVGAPGWASPSVTASSTASAARSRWRASSGGATASGCCSRSVSRPGRWRRSPRRW